MRFQNIIGHQHIKQSLIQAVLKEQVAHAVMFWGQEGSAQLTLSLAYATYLHCENKQENDACGECSACLKNKKLIHPDLHFIFPVANTSKVSKANTFDFMNEWRSFASQQPYSNLSQWLELIEAESKQPQISVEASRSIVQTLALKAFESKFKVLLLWLPEYLNISAANAMLKILEEPPTNTVFIFVSNQPQKLLSTILSRVQGIQVNPFQNDEIATMLQKNYQLSLEKAHELANFADGSFAKAISQIETQPKEHFDFLSEWWRACYRLNFGQIIPLMEKFALHNRDKQKNILYYGLEVGRAMLLKGKVSVLHNPEEQKLVDGLLKVIPVKALSNLYNFLSESIAHLERNANAKILFLDTSIKIHQVFESN